jgi:hypothetical protein
MPTSQSAAQVLDRNFLEVRARLIEIAAAMDRIDRADPDGSLRGDRRLDQLRRSVEILSRGSGPGRAEQILRAFSDEYDPNWNVSRQG